MIVLATPLVVKTSLRPKRPIGFSSVLKVSTNMSSVSQGEKGALKTTLVLRVKYAPVKQPLVEPHVEGSTTLVQVKALAMTHFGLTEGEITGGTKTYQLSFEDVVQSNLNVTLDSLEVHGREVEFLLIEQFIQG